VSVFDMVMDLDTGQWDRPRKVKGLIPII